MLILYMLSNRIFVLFSRVGMQPANIQPRPKDSVLGGLDIGVSNIVPLWKLYISDSCVGMKTDRIRTDINDIIFVFIFVVGFGSKHG